MPIVDESRRILTATHPVQNASAQSVRSTRSFFSALMICRRTSPWHEQREIFSGLGCRATGRRGGKGDDTTAPGKSKTRDTRSAEFRRLAVDVPFKPGWETSSPRNSAPVCSTRFICAAVIARRWKRRCARTVRHARRGRNWRTRRKAFTAKTSPLAGVFQRGHWLDRLPRWMRTLWTWKNFWRNQTQTGRANRT